LDSLEFFHHDLVEQRPKHGTFLFNQPSHLFLQSKKGWRVYGLRHKQSNQVAAQIFLNINGKKVYSPLTAPFGSLELYENVGQKKVEELFTSIEADLKNRNVKFCQIKHYPEAYQTLVTNSLYHALTKLDFDCTEEVSSIIPVDQKLFDKRIAISQRQKLRKSEKRFVFSQSKLAELKKVYGFIKACRHERNQSLSMKLAQLKKVVNKFPRNFMLFQVSDEQQIAAAAIVIMVSDKILYTFYYAHDRRFNRISPTVFLISGIYRYAQEHHFTHIDLGTSMVNGGINRPLIQFKKSIGGQPTIKYIFDKTFS